MKKASVLILIFTLILAEAFFIACDKIKVPNQNPTAISACTLIAPIVKTNTATSGYRKVLLEDYTGHICPNCPTAARTAESIIATYNDRVVILACHVTKTFAVPVNDSTFREEFRDGVCNDWDASIPNGGLEVSSNGLPKGSINRTLISGSYQDGQSNWPTSVSNALGKQQTVQLDVTTTYDPSQTLLNVKVKTTFKQAFANEIKLSLVLTQDSIVGDQKDNAPPAGVIVLPDGITRPNYRFDNVVFGAVNGSWGQTVKVSPANNDTVTIKNECHLVTRTDASSCFFKNKGNTSNKTSTCLNDKYVNLVAFVYDAVTKEVLQVEKLRIR